MLPLMRKTSGAGADDFPIVIAAMPASAGQHKIAFRGFAIMVVFVAIVTLANIEAVRVEALVPITQTVMSLVWLLTAAFLFAQYSVQPQRAQLILASGFVFSGLFAVLHTLAFPGAYGPGVVMGDELSSAGWLFLWWHTTFPLTVIAYTLAKDSKAAERPGRSTWGAIGITIACVVAVTAGLTWDSTVGAAYLPRLFKDTVEQEPFAKHGEIVITLLNTAAIVLLFIRRRTILDQWLIVTLFAWFPNLVAASFFTLHRFTLGWYLARVYALFAGSSLLIVLLTETLRLYARLARAVVLLRRSEQHQRLLIAELDHRVKNTLAQVVGVVSSTFQGSGSTADYVQSLRGRIQSMAAAHTLLSESSWRSVSLNGLLRIELGPYATGRNVEIAGADIMLTPAQTQALAKVLHELATNAAKYGSLSTPGGRVSVTWDRKPNEQAATLVMEWREGGGPPVAARVESSYGTSLIRELIPYELGGKVDLVFASDGACCRIEFPLEVDA